MYGDTAAGRKRVAQLREQSGDIRALAARLVSQAEAVPWHGKAADAMRERIKERAHHLRTAAAHHETAADSLAAAPASRSTGSRRPSTPAPTRPPRWSRTPAPATSEAAPDGAAPDASDRGPARASTLLPPVTRTG